MADTTLILPTGTKYRARSARRYVLVAEYTPGRPATLYRTDNLGRAVKALDRWHSAQVVDTVKARVRIARETWVDARTPAAQAKDAERPNLSAACGAWQDLDGGPAHRYCTGHVNLPAPRDVCECECHAEAAR